MQVICATLLTKEQVRITNVPEILDILKLIELLKGMGVKVEHPAHGEFVFQASHIDYSYFETEEFYVKSEEEMKQIAHCIALTARDFEGTQKEVHDTVAAICEKFPLYK